MAKTCPSCGYSPIGPFTDNCPICAEPVRNVRSGGAGPAQPWNLLRWAISGVVVLVLGIGGCCGYGTWFTGNAFRDAHQEMERIKAEIEADRKARTVVVAAKELLQEFQDDPAAADKKYTHKHLEISGVMERSGKTQSQRPFVILHGGDDNAKLKIECFMQFVDPKDVVRFQQVEKGQMITVRGEYDGQVSNVQVREGIVVK